MLRTIRDIEWPNVFVVWYRDGSRETLLWEREGVTFLPLAPDVEEPDVFIAWPVNPVHPPHFPKFPRGRFVEMDDVEKITDASGKELWSRSSEGA